MVVATLAVNEITRRFLSRGSLFNQFRHNAGFEINYCKAFRKPFRGKTSTSCYLETTLRTCLAGLRRYVEYS